MEQSQHKEIHQALNDVADQEEEVPTLLDVLNENDDAEETEKDNINNDEPEANNVEEVNKD